MLKIIVYCIYCFTLSTYNKQINNIYIRVITLETWLGTVRTSVQGQGICTDTASRVASGERQLLLRSILMVSLPFVGLDVVMSVKCSL